MCIRDRIGKVQAVEDIDLFEIIQKVKVNLDMVIKETNARIECAGLPVIKGTTIEMGQLFQNLIENSIKYRSSEAPHIQVSAVNSENNGWLFCIKDNGIGIDPVYSDRIFDIFERLHTKSEYSGTGIGLAICKKIVGHYGGKIWVESQPGKGSSFYFTLPNQVPHWQLSSFYFHLFLICDNLYLNNSCLLYTSRCV